MAKLGATPNPLAPANIVAATASIENFMLDLMLVMRLTFRLWMQV
jgi:hypothetical protein